MKIKKSVFALVLAVTMLFSTAVGAVASNGIEKIQASLNHNIKFLLNGSSWSPKDPSGKTLSALVFKGSTYVPLRSVSEALGAAVDWDASTSTITIDGDDNNGIPYNDASSNQTGNKPSNNNSGNSGSNNSNNNSGTTNNNNASTPSAGASTAAASYSDPVPLGKTYSFSDKYIYDTDNYSYDGTITVKKVESMTHSQVVDLGYNVKNDPEIEYAVVTLNMTMKNAKNNSAQSEGLMLGVYFKPYVWGSKTTDNDYIIGGRDFGFDGALSGVFSDKLGTKSIKKGETGSYDITGKVILPVVKGKTNYLVMVKKDSSDYQASLLHFKLK